VHRITSCVRLGTLPAPTTVTETITETRDMRTGARVRVSITNPLTSVSIHIEVLEKTAVASSQRKALLSRASRKRFIARALHCEELKAGSAPARA